MHLLSIPCSDPEGGRGSGLPPPPIKIILSNTGPDPLKITKLPSQLFMLVHHWHASEMHWRFAGELKMAPS